LPVVIHTRDADADTLRILQEACEDGRVRGVIHCFSGDRTMARAVLDLGLHISFSGILTFKKSEELRRVAASIPEDRILVETDAPYLAPAPFRGKPNEPAFVVYTAAEVARCRGLTATDVTATTTENFFRLFNKIDRPCG
jgi:TatD DNase family protein